LGKTKYKCKTCRRTFYHANHKLDNKQKERILKEYLNRMRGISRKEDHKLQPNKENQCKGIRLYISPSQLKNFTSKFTILDKSWTYALGTVLRDPWIWNALADGSPFFMAIGIIRLFVFYAVLFLRVRLIVLMIIVFIKFLIIMLLARGTLTRLKAIILTVGLTWLGWLGILGQ